jgi:hypothetical protein
VNAAFQALLIAWSPGNAKVSFQPLILVAPRLSMVTLTVKAPGQLLRE